MDHDGRADIVTMDDSGEINILYGEVSANGAHIFRKHLIEKGLGLRLSGEVRSDGGAFSYAGLTFPTQNIGLQRKALDPDANTGTLNQEMIDNLIYYQYAYGSDNAVAVGNNQQTALQSAVGNDPTMRTPDTQAANNIAALIEKTRTIAGPGNTDFSALETSTRDAKTTFVRSVFAE